VKTWLVTGAGGLFGANAGTCLTGRVSSIGAYRSLPESSPYDSLIELDLLDLKDLAARVTDARPDVVVHAAALASHEECESHPELANKVNVEATRVIADACRAINATLVYVSTDAVFDGDRGLYVETDRTNPFSVYGETKLLGEDAVSAASADSLIVRTNFFGWSPSGTRSTLEFFVNALRRDEKVNGYTDFTVTSLYVRQLIDIIYELVESPHRGLVHVASRDALSKYSFGMTVAEVFGLQSSLISPAASNAGAHGTSRQRDISLSTERLASWLGHPLPSQGDGIRAAFDDEGFIAPIIRGH
jgi:dTDP-4-dehydrorhamnose reductase